MSNYISTLSEKFFDFICAHSLEDNDFKNMKNILFFYIIILLTFDQYRNQNNNNYVIQMLAD